jgi:hypothetical protein
MIKHHGAIAFLVILCSAVQDAHSADVPVDVTWDPAAAHLTTASPFEFNRITTNTQLIIQTAPLSDLYNSFDESGYIRLSSFQLDGVTTSVPNLGYPNGSPYDLLITFGGTGTYRRDQNDSAFFSSFAYTLFGLPQIGTITFNDALGGRLTLGNFENLTILAGGFLPIGGLPVPVLSFDANGVPAPSMNLTTLLNDPNTNPQFVFFVDPPRGPLSTLPSGLLYPIDLTFTNSGTLVDEVPINGGTRYAYQNVPGVALPLQVTANTPEPETYEMILVGGLCFLGFLARKNRRISKGVAQRTIDSQGESFSTSVPAVS